MLVWDRAALRDACQACVTHWACCWPTVWSGNDALQAKMSQHYIPAFQRWWDEQSFLVSHGRSVAAVLWVPGNSRLFFHGYLLSRHLAGDGDALVACTSKVVTVWGADSMQVRPCGCDRWWVPFQNVSSLVQQLRMCQCNTKKPNRGIYPKTAQVRVSAIDPRVSSLPSVWLHMNIVGFAQRLNLRMKEV